MLSIGKRSAGSKQYKSLIKMEKMAEKTIDDLYVWAVKILIRPRIRRNLAPLSHVLCEPGIRLRGR